MGTNSIPDVRSFGVMGEKMEKYRNNRYKRNNRKTGDIYVKRLENALCGIVAPFAFLAVRILPQRRKERKYRHFASLHSGLRLSSGCRLSFLKLPRSAEVVSVLDCIVAVNGIFSLIAADGRKTFRNLTRTAQIECQ